MSIPISISWSYATEHHLDGEMTDALQALIDNLCMAVPAEYDGTAGGTSLIEGDDFPSDCSHYFIVPNMECARDIQKHLDAFLKHYDPRYEAVLERNDLGEDADDL